MGTFWPSWPPKFHFLAVSMASLNFTIFWRAPNLTFGSQKGGPWDVKGTPFGIFLAPFSHRYPTGKKYPNKYEKYRCLKIFRRATIRTVQKIMFEMSLVLAWTYRCGTDRCTRKFLPFPIIACLVLTFRASGTHSHCQLGINVRRTSPQNWRGGEQACRLGYLD